LFGGARLFGARLFGGARFVWGCSFVWPLSVQEVLVCLVTGWSLARLFLMVAYASCRSLVGTSWGARLFGARFVWGCSFVWPLSGQEVLVCLVIVWRLFLMDAYASCRSLVGTSWGCSFVWCSFRLGVLVCLAS
jgi:hypothetical protein